MDSYRSLLDSLSASIILVDGDLTIRYLNESAEQLIRISASRAMDRFIGELIDCDSGLGDMMVKALAEQSMLSLTDYEFSLMTVLQTCRVDCRLTPVEFSIPSDWLGQPDPDSRVAADPSVCARPESEDEPNSIGRYLVMECFLSGTVEQDHYAQTRQQAGHIMVRGLAHEIRNPLGGMRGAAQLLAQELETRGEKGAELLELTGIIIKEVDRLNDLVERMQSGGEALSNQPLNIHSVLEHCRTVVEPGLPETIQLVTDYDPSLPEIVGDEARLTQAILNVIQNAVEALSTEHTPLGPGGGTDFAGSGRICLMTRIDRRVFEGRSEQVVRVSIEDNGRGIDAELAEHIFEPLVSSKTQGGGLGLAITSDIIRQHQGVINAQCEAGITVFHIYLRLFREKPELLTQRH